MTDRQRCPVHSSSYSLSTQMRFDSTAIRITHARAFSTDEPQLASCRVDFLFRLLVPTEKLSDN